MCPPLSISDKELAFIITILKQVFRKCKKRISTEVEEVLFRKTASHLADELK
jgi:hypothetical protein